MNAQIACKNVVKVKFDGGKETNGKVPEALTIKQTSPKLHPSLSLENIASITETVVKNDHCASPLRSSSKPPRGKQLQSIQLLVEQHNNEVDASEDGYLLLIDAEWMNAWYRFVISNDPALYPGPISNWSLISTTSVDLAQEGGCENLNKFVGGKTSENTLTAVSSTTSLSALTAAAVTRRASQLRGLSFDGEECDFAEELEQFQQKQAAQLLNQQQQQVSPAKHQQGHGRKSASDLPSIPESPRPTTAGSAPSSPMKVTDYDYLTCQFPLQPDLREDIDFYLLPLEAWQALHGWYGGGPPLPRSLKNSLAVRPAVPCAVGHLLLQQTLNPNFEQLLAQPTEGFAEGAAVHCMDLYPPPNKSTGCGGAAEDDNQDSHLPCMQDAINLATSLGSGNDDVPRSLFSFQRGAAGNGNMGNGSFASVNSFDGMMSLSTLSLPSMADLTVYNNNFHPKGTDSTPAGSTTSSSASSTNGGVTPIAPNTVASPVVSTKPAKLPSTYCHVCQRSAVTRCSKCGSIFYCSRDCQTLHWRFHKVLCAKITKKRQLQATLDQQRGEKENEKEETKNATPTATTTIATTAKSVSLVDETVVHDRRGKVGLANLGNSCYMNSSLQCLSHIKPLTLAFLSRRLMADLNPENRDGSGGKLAEQYAKLLEELWFEPARRSVSPHLLKATLGRINSEYAGLAQQDAHELIELLLDKLHEDLNRVKKKPYTEKIEWDGKTPEREVAKEAWLTHGKREDSAVRDLMGSMMRYQLTCPDCQKVSLSFEYHTTLQVAIPRRNTITRRIIFVPQITSLKDIQPLIEANSNLSVLDAVLQYTAPISLEITVDRLCNVRALRDALRPRVPPAHLFGSEDEILLVESAHPNRSAVTRMLRDNHALAKLNEDAVIYAYCPPATLPHQTLVFQRVFEPLTNELHGASGSSNINNSNPHNSRPYDWKSLLQPTLLGVPLLISYDSSWASSRLRYQIFLNALRLFTPGCDLLNKADKALAGGAASIVPQFLLSAQLELRLVDQHGTSASSPLQPADASVPISKEIPLEQQIDLIWQGAAAVATKTSTSSSTTAVVARSGTLDSQLRLPWREACLSLQSLAPPVVAEEERVNNTTANAAAAASGQLKRTTTTQQKGDVEILFGSYLPTNKAVLVEDFAGVTSEEGRANNLIFLSLDFVGETRAMFNLSQIQQLLPSAAGGADPASAGAASKGGISLYQCLQEHTKEEVLESGNEVYCSQCKEHKCLTKVVRFCRPHLPRVLVLSLKRFEFRDVSAMAGFQGAAHREKIDTFVDFPIDGLDLAPYCQTEKEEEEEGATATATATATAVGNSGSPSEGGSTVYDLFAVCNHYGRMGFGHYTAAARDWEKTTPNNSSGKSNNKGVPNNDNTNNTGLSEQWFSYDDNDVSGPLSSEDVEAEVHSRNAYILFYRQRGCPATMD